jgi:hypothetical protein
VSATQIKAVAATGDITTANAYLRSVVLTGGSDAATVVVRAGGSGGTVILTLKAATASTAPQAVFGRAYCGAGIHVTVTGTAPAVTVEYE